MSAERKKSDYGISRRDDPLFKDLTINRSCTDVICCIIFLLCIIGSLSCSIIGYARGDPRRLIYPTDSDGRFCGEGHLKNRPHLFFFDLLQCSKVASSIAFGCPTPQVCVSHCPSSFFTYEILENVEKSSLVGLATRAVGSAFKAPTRADLICRYGVNPVTSKESVRSLVQSYRCAAYYVPSTSDVFREKKHSSMRSQTQGLKNTVVRRCIPSLFNKIANKTGVLRFANSSLQTAFGELLTPEKLENGTRYMAIFNRVKGYAELVFRDTMLVWKHILIGLVIVVMVSLLWIIMLQLIALPIICFSILAFIGLFVFTSYYSFLQYQEIKDGNVTGAFGLPSAYVTMNQQHTALMYTWLVFGCASTVVGSALVLIVLFVWRKICLAAKLIEEASEAICRVPLVMVWPVVTTAMQVGVVAYWLVSALYVGSMGEKEFAAPPSTKLSEAIKNKDLESLLNRVPCSPDSSSLCDFVKYGGKEYTLYMQIYLLFMFFWLMNFAVALGQMTMAGAFTIQYWTMDKNQIFFLDIFTSFWRCVRYHLGSVALGSLIIAIVQIVQVLLVYMDRRLRHSKNKCAVFLVKCLICCMWCIEKVLKYIHKNAYILIAMYGWNFCTASKDAFLLIMRNCLQTSVVDRVVDFIIIISKLAITGGTGVGAYYWFDKRVQILDKQVPDLTYSLLPVAILVVAAFLISSAIFSVLDMAVDSLYLCFLEDLERNDGSPAKPYYMSQQLLRLLHKDNSSQYQQRNEMANDAPKEASDPRKTRQQNTAIRSSEGTSS